MSGDDVKNEADSEQEQVESQPAAEVPDGAFNGLRLVASMGTIAAGAFLLGSFLRKFRE